MTTYYTHTTGFGNNTAYLVVENGETKTVLKDGSSIPSTRCYPEALCDSYVEQGSWKTITAAEAKSLLHKPLITFTLDARAEKILLDEIELNKRDLETDFVSLIYRIQEAGVAKGEAYAKRIIENALDNI